jgi:DNA-binding transcriptional LysR family regulator
MDKLDAMQTFVRVAEAGSFTAVAELLQVDRSAITRQISALEKHLAAKLITRSTRSLTLTPAGAAYLEKCRLILNLVDATETGLREEGAQVRGRVRMAIPLSFGHERLLPLLLEFMRLQPHLELLLSLSDQRSNLIEEGLDLAIRVTANLQSGDIVRRLGACSLQTVASPAYLAQHGTPTHPDDLRHHACLLYTSSSTAAQWTYRMDGQIKNVAVRGRLAANNGLALLEANAAGMGISVQPDFLAEPFLARKAVVEILAEFKPPPLGIYAVLPSNRYIPHRVAMLMDYLAQAFQQTAH